MFQYNPMVPLTIAYLRTPAGTLLPLGLCLVALKFGLVPILRGKLGEIAVSLRLRRLGFPSLNNLILRATDGTWTQIDHVVLTARGVLAIETKNYRGMILVGPRDRQWTQVLGRQRYKFQNPLRQNFKHVTALRLLMDSTALRLLTGARVDGLVVFTGEARFPKGLPPGTVTLRELDRHLLEHGLPKQAPETDPVWQWVTAAAAHSYSLRGAHMRGLRARFGRDRRFIAALVCVALAAALFAYGHTAGPQLAEW